MTWDFIAKIAVLCIVAVVTLAGLTAIGTFIYGVRHPAPGPTERRRVNE